MYSSVLLEQTTGVKPSRLILGYLDQLKKINDQLIAGAAAVAGIKFVASSYKPTRIGTLIEQTPSLGELSEVAPSTLLMSGLIRFTIDMTRKMTQQNASYLDSVNGIVGLESSPLPTQKAAPTTTTPTTTTPAATESTEEIPYAHSDVMFVEQLLEYSESILEQDVENVEQDVKAIKSGGFFSGLKGKLVSFLRWIFRNGLLKIVIFLVGLTLVVFLVASIMAVSKSFQDKIRNILQLFLTKFSNQLSDTELTKILEKVQKEKLDLKNQNVAQALNRSVDDALAEIKKNANLGANEDFSILRRFALRATLKLYAIGESIRSVFEDEAKECDKGGKSWLAKIFCKFMAFATALRRVVFSKLGWEVLKVALALPILMVSFLVGKPVVWITNLVKREESKTVVKGTPEEGKK